MQSTTVEGNKVSIGDSVGFKCDVEQCGTITKISRDPYSNVVQLHLSSEYGFSGEYIGGDTETVQDANDCWVEN